MFPLEGARFLSTDVPESNRPFDAMFGRLGMELDPPNWELISLTVKNPHRSIGIVGSTGQENATFRELHDMVLVGEEGDWGCQA